MIKNLQFDRAEIGNLHIYNNNRGGSFGTFEFEGFIKCKLAHNSQFSVIIPDLIYVMNDEENISWFQFYSFLPNHLAKFSESEIAGIIHIDIAWGQTLTIIFEYNDHQTNFEDNSNLYNCKIRGPENLIEYATGNGKVINGKPYLNLYHHTTEESKVLINDSSHYRGSEWNYQGSKKLQNICYAYFTSLDRIANDQDLSRIAMANEGTMYLTVDISLEIVPIKVYRESTTNRTATLSELIDSTILMNNPIYMHTQDDGSYVYYEVSNPFIYRVGLKPKTVLPFNNQTIESNENVKLADHIVLGDSTTVLGLLAPFDEEFTTHIFKIESFSDNSTNILKFWFDNSNKDLYTSKNIERPKFDSQ